MQDKMTDEELAEKIHWQLGDKGYYFYDKRKDVAMITSALRKARQEERERCARAAWSWKYEDPEGVIDVDEAIRRLE